MEIVTLANYFFFFFASATNVTFLVPNFLKSVKLKCMKILTDWFINNLLENEWLIKKVMQSNCTENKQIKTLFILFAFFHIFAKLQNIFLY